jgi:hypothetical protein
MQLRSVYWWSARIPHVRYSSQRFHRRKRRVAAVLSCKVGYANSGVANFRRTYDVVNRCEYGVWSVDRQGVSGVVDEYELVLGEPGGQTVVACLKPAGRGGGDPGAMSRHQYLYRS